MNKVKLEMHTHTKYSYDTDLSFEQIIDKCIKEEIKVLAVTDHNEIDGAIRLSKIAPFKVIIGEEINTRHGEVIGLFLKKFIKPNQSILSTIKEIKKQGGLVYLPHPYDKTTRKTAVQENKLDSILPLVDIIETYNGRTIFRADNRRAEKLNKKVKKISGVGSDAHTIFEFGRNYAILEDFNDQKNFLLNLKSAKLYKKEIIPWVFLLTKLVRFKKKKLILKDNFIVDNNFKCDLCGSSKYIILHKSSGKPKKQYFISDDSYGVHSQIVGCFDCGLILCYPRINEQEMLKRYSNFEDQDYEKERSARKENQKKILMNIEKLIKHKGSILDVGAATGAFIESARDLKWQAYGIEPSMWAVKYAREKYKLKIHKGILDNNKFKKSSFDAISLIDVIEHVSSPRKLLEKAYGLLKKKGIVVVVTPDISSYLSKIFGEKWWHIRPDHIYYFNINTLKLLANSIGFEIVKIKRAGWNFSYGYWISRFKKNIPILYKIFKIIDLIPIFNLFTKRNYSINFHDSWEVYLQKNV